MRTADTGRFLDFILNHVGKSGLKVSSPGDRGYSDATWIWNGAVAHRPLLVAHCFDAAAVSLAIQAARASGMPISVRGGGHDWTGRSLRDEGLVIDLSNMRGVSIDRQRHVATVEGGTTAIELCNAAAVCSLAAVVSYTGATVGVAGLLLGGGYGPLTPRFGLSCDSLISAQVVLADGRIVTASDTENADLFWGLRGGGGNFGVVTSLQIQLYDVPTLQAGSIVFPWSDARSVMLGFAQAMASAPDELSMVCAMVVAESGDPVIALAPAWSGDIQGGDKIINRLRELGRPLFTAVGPMTPGQMLTRQESSFPKGRHYAVSTRWLPQLTPRAISVLLEAFEARASPHSIVGLHHFHGAGTRIAPEATAFGMRERHFTTLTYSAWEPNEDAGVNRKWASDLAAHLRPCSHPGGYANLLGPEAQDQIDGAYGANGSRLRVLKRQLDPENIFSSAVPIPA